MHVPDTRCVHVHCLGKIPLISHSNDFFVGRECFFLYKTKQTTRTTTTATVLQWYSCGSCSGYLVSTLATVQHGATAASHMEFYVAGVQPYDNKQLCNKSARIIWYDAVYSRSGVGVGTPLICGRKNETSEYIFSSGCCSKFRSLISISKQKRTHDQAQACHASYIPTRWSDICGKFNCTFSCSS